MPGSSLSAAAYMNTRRYRVADPATSREVRAAVLASLEYREHVSLLCVEDAHSGSNAPSPVVFEVAQTYEDEETPFMASGRCVSASDSGLKSSSVHVKTSSHPLAPASLTLVAWAPAKAGPES